MTATVAANYTNGVPDIFTERELTMSIDWDKVKPSTLAALATIPATEADQLVAHGMALQAMADSIHASNKAAGWWTSPQGDDVTKNPLAFVAKAALVMREASEAIEADRCGSMDDKLPHMPGRVVELLDTIIRALDLLGAVDGDVFGAYIEKSIFNSKRSDHKMANRQASGGKAY